MITFLRIDKSIGDKAVQQLLTLQQACFAPPWSCAQIEQQLSSNRGFNFFLQDDQQIIGFLYCQYVFDEIEILQVAISPSKRGQGLGRTLISELLTFINVTNKQLANIDKQININNVAIPEFTRVVVKVLLEVRASNNIAIALYRQLGFKLDGTRKGYYPATILGGCSEDAQLYSLVVS